METTTAKFIQTIYPRVNPKDLAFIYSGLNVQTKTKLLGKR